MDKNTYRDTGDVSRESARKSARKFSGIVRNFIEPEHIVMYGSYADGVPRSESDIDVAVIFKGFQGNWLETSKKLWHTAWEVDNRIEPVILDMNNDASGFCQHVLSTGIML